MSLWSGFEEYGMQYSIEFKSDKLCFSCALCQGKSFVTFTPFRRHFEEVHQDVLLKNSRSATNKLPITLEDPSLSKDMGPPEESSNSSSDAAAKPEECLEREGIKYYIKNAITKLYFSCTKCTTLHISWSAFRSHNIEAHGAICEFDPLKPPSSICTKEKEEYSIRYSVGIANDKLGFCCSLCNNRHYSTWNGIRTHYEEFHKRDELGSSCSTLNEMHRNVEKLNKHDGPLVKKRKTWPPPVVAKVDSTGKMAVVMVQPDKPIPKKSTPAPVHTKPKTISKDTGQKSSKRGYIWPPHVAPKVDSTEEMTVMVQPDKPVSKMSKPAPIQTKPKATTNDTGQKSAKRSDKKSSTSTPYYSIFNIDSIE